MEAKDSTEDLVATPSMEEAALSARTEWEAFRVEAPVILEEAVMLRRRSAWRRLPWWRRRRRRSPLSTDLYRYMGSDSVSALQTTGIDYSQEAEVPNSKALALISGLRRIVGAFFLS
jgi:hypothetical protein